MWALSGSIRHMLSEIEFGKNEKEVRIMGKPSKRLIYNLLQRTEVRKIWLSEGVAKATPKSVIRGLGKAGVEIGILKAKRGRPLKIPAKRISGEAIGMKMKDAMKKYGICKRTYFYWKKKAAVQ